MLLRGGWLRGLGVGFELSWWGAAENRRCSHRMPLHSRSDRVTGTEETFIRPPSIVERQCQATVTSVITSFAMNSSTPACSSRTVGAARAILAICLVLGCVFHFACASTMPAYAGPRRPAQTVARLHAPDIEIEEVDGFRRGWNTSDFEIAPGPHSALVRIEARRGNAQISSDALRVCFIAEAGHIYSVIPRVAAIGVGQGRWSPRIADETVNAWVPSKSLVSDETACTVLPTGPVFRIAWPLGSGNIRSTAMQEREGYFLQVKARLETRWYPVEEYSRKHPPAPDLGMRKWVTVLHVQIHADGSLMNVQIAVPSGSPLLDQIAVTAVQQAQPFPTPSSDLVKLTGMTTIPMAFEIMSAGKSPEANR